MPPRQHSFTGLVRKAVIAGFRRVVFSSAFVQMYVLKKGMKPRSVMTPHGAIEVRAICREDILKAAPDFADEDPAWLDRTEERLGARQQCWGLLFEGKVACVIWVATAGQVPLTEIGGHLSVENRVYLFDAKTPSRFRGRGFYPYLMAAVCEYFPGQDRWIGTLTDNYASIAGIQKVGFERERILYSIRIFGIRVRSSLTKALSEDRP